MLQVADVAAQLFVIHLGILLHFLLEIRRRLGKIGEGGHVEHPVVGHGRDVERAFPALFVNPAIQIVGPVGAVGVDAARDGEAGGVELKDGDVAELVAIGIEELVVVDVVVLTENPFAVGAQVGLRRLAFNLVMQSFLALVGAGQVELVGEKQANG